MALIECSVCGCKVNTTAQNYIFANGIHQHKKCPSKAQKLSPKEVRDRKELTDAIQWLAVKYGKPLNWGLISAQIKRLVEQGYSFEDQLYALKWLVEKDGEFWGFGRVEKFILHAMEHKKKLQEFEMRKRVVEQSRDRDREKQEIKVVSKPTFFDMGGEDLPWL